MNAIATKQPDIKQKMVALVANGKAPAARDYEEIANDFNVQLKDAKQLLSLLKSCFDAEGNFLRRSFEQHLPFFIRFEQKMFEFFWLYMKAKVVGRNNRVAFLNSLQLLIDQLHDPKQSIKTLLSDFLRHPERVDYSDRNAMILCNLLLRTYNKELNMDIEITPEEVLLVRQGINWEVTAPLARVIDTSYQERFTKKIKTIHLKLIQSLSPKAKSAGDMPFRYLLSLEREAYIFLSLTGGRTARLVLKAAMMRFGDPDSVVYKAKESKKNILSLLQHLKLIIRGIGRVGEQDELALLTQVSWKEQAFNNMLKNAADTEKVRQVMAWIEKSREAIVARDLKDNIETDRFSIG